MRVLIPFQFILVLTLITTCQITLKAQAYHPMPTGTARWDIARCWYFYPGGWYDRYYIEMDGTDTVIHQKTYKKLFHTTHHAPGTAFDSTYTHFLGGMRESGKQVFMISEYLCLDTMERIIYDFNEAAPGDTILTQVLTNGLTQYIPHMVTAVDQVEVNGELHRRLHLQDENGFFNETWTEGVGSNMGFVYASYWILTDNSYDLNCFYTENQLRYTNPSPAYAFCTPPFPDSECEPVITSTDQEAPSKHISMYPNPVITSLFVEPMDQVASVEVYTPMGVKLQNILFTHELDLSHLSPGMYILRISMQGANQVQVERVIKL